MFSKHPEVTSFFSFIFISCRVRNPAGLIPTLAPRLNFAQRGAAGGLLRAATVK